MFSAHGRRGHDGKKPRRTLPIAGTVRGPPSSVVNVPIGERLNVHAEYFGIVSSGKEIPLNLQYASLGGHVLATEDLEIGLRVGWGLNEATPGFFSSVGLGLRS